MKDLKTFVEGLKMKFFPSKDDKVWKQWVDFKDRKTEDLTELLLSDVGDNFKKRLLFLLIVPSVDFNPLYWKNDIGGFYQGTDFLKTLTADQLDYATDLIVEFCLVLNPMHCNKPKKGVESGGITVAMLVPEKYHDALYFYNACILRLLILLPEEKANKIFPLFSLIDISTYCNMDDASGYHSFRDLLDIEEVDERWKKVADTRMRDIILLEANGKIKSREKWEKAICQYASIVQYMLCGNKIKYSLELCASQIQFIMDNCQNQNKLIDNWQVIKLFKLFSGDYYKGLRHVVARYALLENTGEFSRFYIYSNKTQQAVDQMLEEFDDDLELVGKIRELEEERDIKQAENKARQAKEQAVEDKIMVQMK